MPPDPGWIILDVCTSREMEILHEMERYYAAACQCDLPNPGHRGEIAARVDRLLEMINYAVVGYEPFFDVKLVVFPEFAHAAPVYPTADELLDKLAVSDPQRAYRSLCTQGEGTKRLYPDGNVSGS